eukprot:6851272-Ditylum_brightwellii.AAC.2
MLEKVLDLFNTLDVDKCCKCSTSKIMRAILSFVLKKHCPRTHPTILRGDPVLLDTITGVPSAKK